VTQKHRNAGLKAAETKGPEERTRAAQMAAWTRTNGKDDSRNPYSKQNSTIRSTTSAEVRTGRSTSSNSLAPELSSGVALRHSEEILRKIETHFHAVIRARAGKFIDEHGVQLPTLAPLLLAPAKAKTWFPIPGMCGGFNYWLKGHGDKVKLIAESWCRVVEGSGQRHEVTAEGSKLVAEGFV